MSRKALVVGIDHYQGVRGLYGCVRDAQSVKGVLARNSDGKKNFGARLMTSSPAILHAMHLPPVMVDLLCKTFSA